MKNLFKIITFAIFLLSTTLIASNEAEAWWSVDSQIIATRTYVEARVHNRWDRPIYCEGKVYGRTASGHILSSWGSGVIYPGKYAGIYVYTNRQNPFVNGWADMRCRWN